MFQWVSIAEFELMAPRKKEAEIIGFLEGGVANHRDMKIFLLSIYSLSELN